MPIRNIFFFLLLFFTIFFLYETLYISYLSYTSSYEPQKTPVHLLIVSSWRSGSSFLGQIFNHHHDVFYLFEPGYPIWMRFRKESAELLHYPVRDLFHSLFTCDVSPLYQYLPQGGRRISNMAFFAESRALCSPPSCPLNTPLEGYDRYKCYSRCRNITLEKMTAVCNKYSHVVMKTVRILDLSILRPLFQDPNLDLRIVHLVRDPRAVASSRKFFNLNIDDRIVFQESNQNVKIPLRLVMSKICNAQVTINKFAKAASLLSYGRYMLVRHEDLALDPVKNVREIFRFADLELNEEMERWIYNITHGEVKTNRGFMAFSRQSSSVVEKWRWKMNFKTVKEIERVCRDAMNWFGYLPVKSVRDLHNSSVDLIL